MTGDYTESYKSTYVSSSSANNNMLPPHVLRPQSPQHLDSCLDTILDDLQATVSRPSSRLEDYNKSSAKRYVTSSAATGQQFQQKSQVQQDIDQLVQMLDDSNSGLVSNIGASDSRISAPAATNLNKNVWHNDMNAGDMTYTRTETVTRDRFGTDSTGRIYRGTSPLRLTGPGAPALNAPSTTKSFVYTDHKVNTYIPPASNKGYADESREAIEYNIPITKEYTQGPTSKSTTIDTSYSYEVKGDGGSFGNMKKDSYNQHEGKIISHSPEFNKSSNFDGNRQYQSMTKQSYEFHKEQTGVNKQHHEINKPNYEMNKQNYGMNQHQHQEMNKSAKYLNSNYNQAHSDARNTEFERKGQFEFHNEKMTKSNVDKSKALPPQHVDELMESFSNSMHTQNYKAGNNANMSSIGHSSGKYSTQERYHVDGTNKYNAKESASLTRSNSGSQSGGGSRVAASQGHNVIGSPVYYPPNYEINSRRGQANLGAGPNYANTVKQEHWDGSNRHRQDYVNPKSRSRDNAKKVPVPICLPLCCGLPCTIM